MKNRQGDFLAGAGEGLLDGGGAASEVDLLAVPEGDSEIISDRGHID